MSGYYFDKKVILKYSQEVACLWNASPTIFKLQAVTLVICEFWATGQPVCELQAVS